MPFPPFASEADALQLLRVALQGVALATQDDLRAWLAGPVRTLLPHEAMLVASGDFRRGDLHCELICPDPQGPGACGLQATLAPWVNYLRDCWVAAQHTPCRVDVVAFAASTACARTAAGPVSSDPIRSALVHGTRDTARPGECIVAVLMGSTAQAACTAGRAGDSQAQAMRLLAPVIDTALRRAPVQPARQRARALAVTQAGSCLTERERQIMEWVALGKTNPEIGCILRISEFTVKNHLKSIFAKLDVSNRAQAVARLSHRIAHA